MKRETSNVKREDVKRESRHASRFTHHVSIADWRLLQTGLADGATNMAIDEAILWAVAEGRSRPTLRFYGWQPPCLSIGYSQSMEGEVDVAGCREAGIDFVRRPTGGRAILHADELTYSVVAPQTEPRVAGGVIESYRRLSTGLVAGLRALGVDACQALAPTPPAPLSLSQKTWERGGQHRLLPPVPPRPPSIPPNPREEARGGGPVPPSPRIGRGGLGGRGTRSAACFDAPSSYEITVGGKKLVGSAQVRKKRMVLQHGSLPLEGDITRIFDFLRALSEERREELKQELRIRATSLELVLGYSIPFDEVARHLAAGFVQALNLRLIPGRLSQHELALAEKLRREKYAARGWSFRG